jgi:hypothetical protein
MFLSLQNTYDRVRTWYSKPGAVYGYNEETGKCVYRGNDDPTSQVRCAGGVVLPNGKYDPNLEGSLVHDQTSGPWMGLFGKTPIEAASGIHFLQDIQHCHDEYAENDRPMADFIEELDEIAAAAGLVVPDAA